MKNVQEIRDLAAHRVVEAEYLMQSANNDFSAAAFYLAGYAVELTLKARICELFGKEDFFGTMRGKTSTAFKIHDIEELFFLLGATKIYNEQANEDIKSAFSTVISWDETTRYKPPKAFERVKVLKFIESVKKLIAWIQEQKV